KMKHLVKKKKNILLGILFVAIVVCTPFLFGEEGCDDGFHEVVNSVDQNIQNGADNNSSNSSNGVRLGKKKENPFTVVNMQKAYESLAQRANGALSRTASTIRATHYYVKFKPNTDEEYEKLKNDTINIKFLFPVPVEYEITGEGMYRDPAVSENQPTYQYTAVRIDYQFPPNIPYEILEELYLPKEDGTLGSQNSRNNGDDSFIDDLVKESMLLTKNITENEAQANQRTNWSRYRPAGIIKMYNALGNLIGIEGVVVRAGYWYDYSRGTTDINGNYSCDGTFLFNVRYYIDWERYHFAVEAPNGDGAHYWGPDQRGNWNLYLNDLYDIDQWKYAEMFSAGYLYYYKDIYGLERPAQNCSLCDQLDIQLTQEAAPNNGDYFEIGGFYRQARIRYNLDYRKVFGVTIHELAHSAHSQFEFLTNSTRRESWANGVQTYLTRYKRGYTCYSSGLWRIDASNDYNGVVWDLLDGPLENYSMSSCVSLTLPLLEVYGRVSNTGDNVENGLNLFGNDVDHITILSIETAMRNTTGPKTWNAWKDELMRMYPSKASAISSLFASWRMY
ncbi:MAG: hypothetical protein QM536_04155, partial [Chitinophagaceae bacterium]|nr:hypothetical protein [Chitinophagaceae bacterium]